MAQRLDPAARDAAMNRANLITVGVIALSLAGTLGLGVAIAAKTPDKPAVTSTTAPASQGYGGSS